MLNTYMTISMKTLYFCAIFAVESEKEINVKMMDEITFITDLWRKCAILSIYLCICMRRGKKVSDTKILI